MGGFKDVEDRDKVVWGADWVVFKAVADCEEGVGVGLGGIQGCGGLGRRSSGMGLGGFKVGLRGKSRGWGWVDFKDVEDWEEGVWGWAWVASRLG